MDQDLTLRRKYALKAHGRRIVLIKKAYERHSHVMMKAFLWALYLPIYPDMLLEIYVNDRYKPDVVDLDDLNIPKFWGEAGRLGLNKIHPSSEDIPTPILPYPNGSNLSSLMKGYLRMPLPGLDAPDLST